MSGNRPQLSENSALLQLLAQIGDPDNPPGAVAASGLVAAVSAAIASSSQHGLSKSRLDLESQMRSALQSADQDTNAYWGAGRSTEATTTTPSAVIAASHAIHRRLLAVDEGNRADIDAAKAVALGAAAAVDAVARHNLEASRQPGPDPSGRLLMAANGPGSVPLLQAARGAGCYIEDEDGVEWFDATSGMWNVPLGHGHPSPITAMLRQSIQLAACDPFVAKSEVGESAARRVAALLDQPDSYVFFGSSGSEAIEVALRVGLAALPDRAPVWSLPGSFHGSTAGAASLADSDDVWGPLPREMRYARAASSERWTAPGLAFVDPAIIFAMTERGARSSLRGIDSFQQRGGLLVIDEIAVGLGRGGWPTASRRLNLSPDLVLLGKGLGNGVVPVSAVIIREKIAYRAFRDTLDYGHTHSNHPVGTAVAQSTISELERLDHARVEARLTEILESAGLDPQGTGALRAVGHGAPRSRAEVTRVLSNSRLITHVPSTYTEASTLTIAPPLVATDSELHDLAARAASAVRNLGW